jgi:DNA-binding CsgD family transcriptional regulator
VTSATGALLERERELEALRGALDRAAAGEGMLVLIEGPAGVGKTELEREARAAAERTGMTALDARGSELERPFAFGVVRQLLESVIGDVRERPELFAGAARPAARLFEHETGSVDGDVGFEALHSLYWLVVNLADRGPLLVLVDDCQWADGESLRFLAYLAQRIEGLPVAIVLAGRPPETTESEAAALWSQVASRASAVALYPQQLSPTAATALTRERLGTHADEDFCRACHTATGGNPLFLRELLRALDAAGVVPSTAAAAEVQSVGPGAVRRFVLHRVGALGAPATELALSVAVMGDDSELRLAAQVSGLGEAEARDLADELGRADIFVRGERLGFVHPIVRAALYEDLAPGERQARHAMVAAALARERASPERITAHLMLTSATGDQSRVATLREAALVAAHRGAPRAAAARLRRALAESPAEQERAEILAELGSYEVAAMQFEAAEEHLQECLRSGGSLSTRADAALTLGRCAAVSEGRSAKTAAAALRSLAEELAPIDAERSLVLGSALLTIANAVLPLRSELSAHLRRFREQARGHPEFESVARIHAAQQQLFSGASTATVIAEIHAALAAGLPPGADSNPALLALITLRWAEDYDLPARALDVALEQARREGHAARQGVIHGQRAALALARGDLHDAQVEAETGLLLVEKPHFALLQLAAVGVVVHIERGALEDAAAMARTGETLGVAEPHVFAPEFLIARGRMRIAQGRLSEGMADLRWCGERLEAIGVRSPSDWRAYLAQVLVSVSEREAAATLAHEQLEITRRAGAPRGLGLALRAAATASDGEERLGLLEEAVSVLEASPSRLELAHALGDLGAELSRVGRRREGRDVLRSAIKLADECGALVLAERARTELQAGPGRRARIELTGRSALTAAEWRVCRQAADGRTNREIAQALFVTEKTVERHLSSAYQKLGIRSRFQLRGALGD